MFEAVTGPIAQSVNTDAAAQANPQPGPESAPQSVIFHAATGLDESAIATVRANVRKRILRAFVARGHLETCDAKDMAERAASSSHGGGFSEGVGVRIEAPDRAGLERLPRYCARPPFAMDRLKQRASVLVYRCGKGHTEPLQSDKYAGELVLTPNLAHHRMTSGRY
ncbi:putative transposase tnA2 [Rhodoferax antarcticus ANT.BR]|uniref:Putative transposase tnA2 n=1 Tax=Rhodoferax antarcticus ANT.BR TaxID=1111071 RepID=A0A1Q8YDV6_9BURK|nr:putative transposase tnA2 [Rhodoferax antarcticus ANT.BR]